MRFSKSLISLLLSIGLCLLGCGDGDGSGTDTDPDGGPDGECSDEDPFNLDQCPDDFDPECTVYVDGEVDSSGDGWSWDSAVKTVQEGIDLAHCGAVVAGICEQWEVWVREGTYYIHQGCREHTVRLRPNAALLGGFDGTETAEFDRDWDANITTLDGRDGPDGENHVYHVVVGSDDATLDGFTITGGRADDDQEGSNQGWGGGMANYYTSSTVAHCVFEENFAIWSGGMDIYNSSLVVSDCTFINNESKNGGAVAIVESTATLSNINFLNNSVTGPPNSGYGQGGGISILFDSNVTLERCNFIENSASRSGGGLMAITSFVSLEECEFIGNSAGNMGGGVYANKTVNMEISDSIFRENSSNYGGGIATVITCSLLLENTLFEDNTATLRGGGLYVFEDSTAIVLESTFDGNTTTSVGGGVSNETSDITYTNSVFTRNSAGLGNGGAMHSKGATTQATNCTFYDNTAQFGATLYSTTSSPDYGELEDSSTIINSIAWNNSTLAIEWDEATPIVTYSDIEGGFKGAGNIDLDPLFVDPANGDLHLQSESPCIGAALPEAAPETDFDGNPRDDEPDMGAFEVQ